MVCLGNKALAGSVANLSDESAVVMVGEHRLPVESTIPTDSVNFFAIKVKSPDLFASQDSIISALKTDETPNRYKTLVPGTYKVNLLKGEYLIIGRHQYYQFQSNPGRHNFLEFMVKLENGQVLESTVMTGYEPAEQSEFAVQSNPRFIPNDGVMGQRLELENFKYEVEGNEVTVSFPAYIDGRKFQ
jgi:hypothetical protein